MLVNAQLIQVPTVDRLAKIWRDRYVPKLQTSIGSDPAIFPELRNAASAAGRAQTAAKLHEHLVDENCRLAILRTKDLYAYLPSIFDLGEAKRIAQFATQIYLKLISLYQEETVTATSASEQLFATMGNAPLSVWGIPNLEKLAAALDPLLLAFQEQHAASKDWRTIGFITTEINFSNALLLQELTPAEQVLIDPFFKFIEEQVALPWQRVCAAAASYSVDAPAFLIVEQMMPHSAEIAATVYDRLLHHFPDHRSRRGGLENAAIQHSCLRDLQMFQAYLWLCVLQGSLTAIDQELVALCIMVMESVGVKWEMTARWNEFLLKEILSRLNREQRQLLQPYADGMIAAFEIHRTRLGAIA